MRQEIIDAMVKTFFASAWADQAQETGNSSQLSGKEIFDIMPTEMDPAAVHAANTLVMDMERANGKPIEEIYQVVSSRIGVADFGHYSALQAMGHGSGLFDFDIDKDEVIVPYVEFGSHSLEKDYFDDKPSSGIRPH